MRKYIKLLRSALNRNDIDVHEDRDGRIRSNVIVEILRRENTDGFRSVGGRGGHDCDRNMFFNV